MNLLVVSAGPAITRAQLQAAVTDRQRCIMRMMRDDSRITCQKMAKPLGVSKWTISADQRSLRALGLVAGPRNHPYLTDRARFLLAS